MTFLLSILIGSLASAAVEKVIEPQKYFLCKNKSVVRTIRVEVSDSGCKAKYTKSGEDRVIGYGSTSSACDQFVENVKGNLENAAWSCRAVTDSKITAQAPSEE